jgi:hypothetical protein
MRNEIFHAPEHEDAARKALQSAGVPPDQMKAFEDEVKKAQTPQQIEGLRDKYMQYKSP